MDSETWLLYIDILQSNSIESKQLVHMKQHRSNVYASCNCSLLQYRRKHTLHESISTVQYSIVDEAESNTFPKQILKTIPNQFCNSSSNQPQTIE